MTPPIATAGMLPALAASTETEATSAAEEED